MTLYIGVDFHPHQQTVAMCNTESGEIEQASLFHNVELVRRFYEQMPKAVVGIEASCTARWFENLMQELGHELRVGNPTQIRARARSRHKSDRRDAAGDRKVELLLTHKGVGLLSALAVVAYKHNCSDLQSSAFSAHIICNYLYLPAQINCN